jgi:copper(I)-binding protein
MMRETLAALSVLFTVLVAHAGQPAVTVSDARVRWLPGELPMAGYFTITSHASEPLRLTGGASPAFGEVMLHRSVEEGGVARMVHMEGVDLAPGQPVAFAPGGYHLMLMQRRQELHAGKEVPVTLHFSDGRTLTVRFRVMGAQDE